MKRRRCKHCGNPLNYDFTIGHYCGTPRCPWMRRWWRAMWDTAVSELLLDPNDSAAELVSQWQAELQTRSDTTS